MFSNDLECETTDDFTREAINRMKRADILKALKASRKDKKNDKFFNEEFPKFDEILISIEYESVSKVEEALLEMKWSTKRELEGAAMMIYEKASMRSDLASKYAQLVKKLENVEVTENGETTKFRIAFNNHFFNFLKNVIDMSELATKRSSLIPKRQDIGRGVGMMLGNLYNFDFYTLNEIITIAKLLRSKKGERNKMMLDFMLSTISVRLSHENISKDMVNNMIGMNDPDKLGKEFDNPDRKAIANFCTFLAEIKEEKIKFFNDYKSFEKISEESHEIDVGCLFQDAYTNEECLNLYRDIVVNIHLFRPDLLESQLKEEFNKVIEKLDAKKQKCDRESAHKFNHLGNLIVEFYTAGLIEDELVESFLNALKGSKMPKIFRLIFLEILKKYEGSRMTDYFQHFRTICTEMPEHKSNIATVQEYIQNRGGKKTGGSKRERNLDLGAASQPDLREFFIKRAKHTETFKCTEKPSCHFAGLRSIDILSNHIGSKFFNKTTIDICSKLTKKMLTIPSESRICDSFEREIKVYYPYFLNDIEPGIKVTNFSNLLISFYDDGIIKYKIVSKWMDQLYDVVKTKKHTFHQKFMEIYSTSFERISKNLIRDDPNAWLIHSNFVDNCEFQSSKFTDYKKFTELIERFKKSSEFTNVNELKKLTITNDKITFKQINKFMIDFYINDKPSASFVASLYTVIVDQYFPRLDKTLFRLEFQDAMCLKLGYICARDSSITSKVHQDGKLLIELIHAMCMKTHLTRLGLATFFNTMAEMLVKYAFPVRELIMHATIEVGKFFIGSSPLPPKVEKIIMDLARAVINSLDVDPKECMKAKDILEAFKEVLDDSKEKKMAADEERYSKMKMSFPLPESSKLNTVPLKVKESHGSSSSTSSVSSISTQSSSKKRKKSASVKGNSIKETSTPIRVSQPKIRFQDISDYNDFCEYFDNLEPKTSKDDEQLFDSNFILTVRFTKKEQISSFSKKFIERISANKASILFFTQNAIKISNSFQNNSKKSPNFPFKKILIDELFESFSGEKPLVEFMCELYNNNFVNKTSMVTFVEKFKTQNPKNLILLQIFVRICGLKLASQGDKQQLVQIRNIAKSFKSSADVNEDLKFIAQDLTNSLSSVISLMENGQKVINNVTIYDLNESMNDEEFTAVVNFIKNANETPEKIAEDLIKKSFKSPQISVKAAKIFDGRVKHYLIQKIQSLLNDVPEISIDETEFRNLVEFLADLYNFEILKNEFLNWCIQVFLKTTDEELSCQCLQIIFENCGLKMEKINKPKLDMYCKFFEKVLTDNEDSIRCEYFKRICILKARNWKVINVTENYFEDFLMLFSINDAKIEELVDILRPSEDEMQKFIQILWKNILKEAPHPTYAILCEEISKSCQNFNQILTEFFNLRCKTFSSLNPDFFNENVKQKLGKVMTFMAEIYNRNLVADETLEMWIDTKLTSKCPSEFIERIFSILGSCKRFEHNKNIKLMALAKNIENVYFEEMEERVKIVMGDLNDLKNMK